MIKDDVNDDDATTYVYHHKDEHVEVSLTGRTAAKNIPSVGTAPERTDTLVEITPVQMEDGRWKRFVRETDLLEIADE